MLISSLKENNSLLKERNSLLSKRMSSIYQKVTIEKKWCAQNFDSELKNPSPGHFLGSSNSHRYNWIFKLLVAT